MKKLILALILLPTITFAQERVNDGILSMYWFNSGFGDVVQDVATSSVPINLRIQDPANIAWQPDGGLTVTNATIIKAELVPWWKSRIESSGELTVEVWATSANNSQSGPARIVAYSVNPSPDGGNFIVGQSGATVECRLRTSTSDQYGRPSISSSNFPSGPTHIVLTKSGGVTKLYINGVEASSQANSGSITTWEACGFSVANEHVGGRPWLGTIYFTGIFEKALTAEEIQTNYAFGHLSTPPEPVPRLPVETEYMWTAPTTGTTAIKYVVQHKTSEILDWEFYTEVTDTLTNYLGFSGVTQWIRVAGVDSLDIQGVFSLASDPYTPPVPDSGPPSKPGKPVRVK
jgi:hypothetical protein